MILSPDSKESVIILFTMIRSSYSMSSTSMNTTNRSAKLFNIFQITNFPNSECNSTSGQCGTCMTGVGIRRCPATSF